MSEAAKTTSPRVPPLRFKGFDGAWEKKRLGDIGSPYNGLSGKCKDDFGHGKGRYVTYLDVFNNAVTKPEECDLIEVDKSQNEVRDGDVFFTTSSETPDEVGMSSVWEGDGTNTYLNSFCFGYRPKDKIEVDYWARMLRADAFRDKIVVLAQGISRYNISKGKVMDLSIRLPSLPEQRKIGACFRSIDGLIEGREKSLEKLQAMKKAMLEKMFPQGDAKVPEVRFKGFDGAWEKKRLGELCTITTGHRDVNEGCVAGEYPFFTCSRVVYRANTFSFEGEAITIAGNGDVGNLHYYYGKFEAYQRTYVLMRFGVDVGYLMQYLEAFLMTELTAGKYGSSMPYIVLGQLTKFVVAFPSLPEQRKIGAYFRSIDGLISARREEVEKLRQMKKALLDRMFA